MAEKTVDEMIQEFINDSIALKKYNTTENLINHVCDPKKTVSMGKKIYKNVKRIVNTQEGIDKLCELLDDDNILIASSVAEEVYPIYPSKSIKVLNEYMETLSDTLDIMPVREMIDGFKKDLPFFTKCWEDLYGDNWRELNREVVREKN